MQKLSGIIIQRYDKFQTLQDSVEHGRHNLRGGKYLKIWWHRPESQMLEAKAKVFQIQGLPELQSKCKIILDNLYTLISKHKLKRETCLARSEPCFSLFNL